MNLKFLIGMWNLAMQGRMVVTAVGVSLGLVLAGCGSSGGDTLTLQEQFTQDLAASEAMGARVSELVNSPFRIFEDAGAVTYTGYALVVVETDTLATELLGDASIVANFDTAAVTGSMTDFVGATGPVGQIEAPPVAAYAGTLTLSNGLVDGPNRPNQFGADFSGTLTGQGNVVVLDGAMIGDFRGGALRNAIVGVSTPDETTTTLNGEAADGFLGVVAEADSTF